MTIEATKPRNQILSLLPLMTRDDHYWMAREALDKRQYTEAHAWAASGLLLSEFGQAKAAANLVGFLSTVDVDELRAEVLEQIDVDPIDATLEVLTRLAAGGVALA